MLPCNIQRGGLCCPATYTERDYAALQHTQRGIMLPCNTQRGIMLPCYTQRGIILPCNTQRGITLPCNTQRGIMLPFNTHRGIMLPCNTQRGIMLRHTQGYCAALHIKGHYAAMQYTVGFLKNNEKIHCTLVNKRIYRNANIPRTYPSFCRFLGRSSPWSTRTQCPS
jgi:hypothetical protein